FNAFNDKAIGMQPDGDGAVYSVLRIGEEVFDIAHYRIQILAFVEHHAVPVGQLRLPVKLPLGKSVLFQLLMRLDDQHGRGGFESHASFNTYNGIAHMDVAADGVGRSQLVKGLDQFYRIILATVEGGRLSLRERKCNRLRLRLRKLARISLFG